MKRVRKTLALLLAVLTVLPLAACAQSGGEAETTAPAVTDTATAAPEDMPGGFSRLI